jgi:hypothetical protein
MTPDEMAKWLEEIDQSSFLRYWKPPQTALNEAHDMRSSRDVGIVSDAVMITTIGLWSIG